MSVGRLVVDRIGRHFSRRVDQFDRRCGWTVEELQIIFVQLRRFARGRSRSSNLRDDRFEILFQRRVDALLSGRGR